MRLLAVPAMLASLASMVSPALATEAEDLVRELYANHSYDAHPPGGMNRWMPHMQALWQKVIDDNARRANGELEWEGEGLSFDFMIGTQEDFFDGLKVRQVLETEGEARILVKLNNGADQPYALYYGFVRDDELGWQLAEVWRADDAWRLSELLKQTR